MQYQQQNIDNMFTVNCICSLQDSFSSC